MKLYRLLAGMTVAWLSLTVAQAHDPPPTELREDERADAVRLAEEAIGLEGRSFHVDTALIADKLETESGVSARRLALVTHYVYEGDLAVVTTVDLTSRKVMEVEKVPHLSVPLHPEEVAAANELALGDPKIQEALGPLAKRVETEMLLLRAATEKDPLFGRRAVRMMFKVGDRYLSWPIAIVDLTGREVELESEKPPQGARRPSELELDTEERDGPEAVAVDPAVAERLTRIEAAIDDLVIFRPCCPRHTQTAASGQVEQQFPPSGPMETAWRVRFGHATSKGLYITGAWFKRTPADAWQRVLWDARLSDIFVPYHNGFPRYLDLTGFSFDLVPVQKVDLGCCGQKADDYVVKEIRDRGMMWKNDTAGRRGHTLVLWATLDAANYNYIMEYGFRDDGMISFRLGATAQNLPGAEWQAHMHNGLWRVDVDLGGFSNDSALLTSHSEPFGGNSASDSAVAFNGGTEGSADWDALKFNGVRVQDTQLVNGEEKPIAYDLMPLRRGRARHAEDFTHHDFWVTRYRSSEIFYTQLPSYANGESVTSTDVVLWHISPAHHLPRQEDGTFESGWFEGTALLMWSGFDLRPRNFFDRTPFYP